MKLLTKQTAKLTKTNNADIVSVILYLDPLHNLEMCPSASPACRKACLIHSGMMRMKTQTAARKARTKMYWDNREAFMAQLKSEIQTAAKSAAKIGKKLDVRLNGTSDLDWSEIYNAFPNVQFHEYTKRPELAAKLHKLHNVVVTFSRHERHSLQEIKKTLLKGINVAVVFESEIPSQSWNGFPTIDGDAHDRRWEDAKGHIIGLRVKGTKETKRFAIERDFATI